jgi:hypothetical protein
MRRLIAVLALALPRAAMAYEAQLTRNDVPEEGFDAGCPGEVSPPDGTPLPANPTIFVAAGFSADAEAFEVTSDRPVGYVSRKIDDLVRIDVALESGTFAVHHPDGRVLARYTIAPRPHRHAVQLRRLYRETFELVRSNPIAFRVQARSGVSFSALPAGVHGRYQIFDPSGESCETTRRFSDPVLADFVLIAIFADGEERRLGRFRHSDPDSECSRVVSVAETRSTTWRPDTRAFTVAGGFAFLAFLLAKRHRRRVRDLSRDPMPAARVVRR